ncbi:hypothetical protein VitviT2T_029365 [Vitis vinifera]|uniref:Trichome birefringence-like N-terminal domain-containing protein n=1 Tax=Vitis vinifera TaxID=29760 RepID=A0ABY9DVY0_VITVI|nr:hypothetical protein VitviT2T_029365 [Vitis vinifera]
MRSNGCNWFLGSWVYNDSYPFYDASKCPFIRNGSNCLKNGRPDKEYLKYKWKPNDCHLPRFNGEDFLKRFKGKKIMFVRDSLSENQWQSLTCMVHAAIPQTHFDTSIKGDLYSIAWPDYEISIILCHKYGRSTFLDEKLSLKSSKRWLCGLVSWFNLLAFSIYSHACPT